MANKFKPGDRVVVKRSDWKSYYESAGGQWGDFDTKEYTIEDWDGDTVTPGYKLKECGFKSLSGGGFFVESWFEPAPIKHGEKGPGKPGEPGQGQGQGQGEGEGEGNPGEGQDGESQGEGQEESKDSKESKDGKNGEDKDMPKKKEDKG